MKVTFLGIGAQKCASSWLYDILADHPEVVVSPTKELDFFSYHYENGLHWYGHQFEHRPGARAAGEISPSYLHEPAVPVRVQRHLPDARIFVSLRDPVERALSQHRHLARLGLLPRDDLSFEAALATNPTYIEQGLYHHHLSRWLAHFERRQLHVVLMEDIRADRRAVARSLFEFLGVNASHVPAALSANSNASYLPRSWWLERTVGAVRKGLDGAGIGQAWRVLGDLGLRRLYRTANRRPPSDVIPDPRPETLKDLRQSFAPDVALLCELLQRDLKHWL